MRMNGTDLSLAQRLGIGFGLFFIVIAALISLFRREHGPGFWALGIGFAGAALVLGWFMMLAIVIGATFLLMVILSTVM